MSDPDYVPRTPIHDTNTVTLGEVYRYLLSFEQRTITAQKAQDDRVIKAISELMRFDLWQAAHGALVKDMELMRADFNEEMEEMRTERRVGISRAWAVITAVVSAAVGGGLGSLLTSIGHK